MLFYITFITFSRFPQQKSGKKSVILFLMRNRLTHPTATPDYPGDDTDDTHSRFPVENTRSCIPVFHRASETSGWLSPTSRGGVGTMFSNKRSKRLSAFCSCDVPGKSEKRERKVWNASEAHASSSVGDEKVQGTSVVSCVAGVIAMSRNHGL